MMFTIGMAGLLSLRSETRKASADPTLSQQSPVAAIPQIIKRIRDFSEVIAETIEPIGIVVTKYQANSNVHVNIPSPENAPLGANIAQGIDIFWD